MVLTSCAVAAAWIHVWHIQSFTDYMLVLHRCWSKGRSSWAISAAVMLMRLAYVV